MNAPLIWRDPVVAEIHAIRAELAKEYGDDLVAYSNAAVAHCQQLNFQLASVVESSPPVSPRVATGASGEAA